MAGRRHESCRGAFFARGWYGAPHRIVRQSRRLRATSQRARAAVRRAGRSNPQRSGRSAHAPSIAMRRAAIGADRDAASPRGDPSRIRPALPQSSRSCRVVDDVRRVAPRRRRSYRCNRADGARRTAIFAEVRACSRGHVSRSCVRTYRSSAGFQCRERTRDSIAPTRAARRYNVPFRPRRITHHVGAIRCPLVQSTRKISRTRHVFHKVFHSFCEELVTRRAGT